MAIKTGYPKFARSLYDFQRVLGEVRPQLEKNANFGPLDLGAFDILKAAVDAATGYFPDYREAE